MQLVAETHYTFAGQTLPRGPNRAAEYARECEAVKNTCTYRRFVPWPGDDGPLPLFVSFRNGETAEDHEQCEHRGPGAEQAAIAWCANAAETQGCRNLGRLAMPLVDILP